MKLSHLIFISTFLAPALGFCQAGSPDNTFSSDGIAVTMITSNPTEIPIPYGIAVKQDGKIVGGGFLQLSVFEDDFLLVQYNPDGSADTTFGNNGVVLTDFGNSGGQAYAMTAQDDGKILLGGHITQNSNFLLVRYNVDGTLDSSFSNDGITTVTMDPLYDEILTLKVQPDGKILAGGGCSLMYYPKFALARFNSDGTLDSSFGVDGKVITQNNGYGEITSIAIRPDGKIIALGSNDSVLTDRTFILIRYNTNGSIDSSFGINGKTSTDFGSGLNYLYDIELQNDGKIVAAGYICGSSMNHMFSLVRFTENGFLDSTFSTDGITDPVFNVGGIAFGLALQSDGKLVAAGWPGDASGMALARYNPDGSLDPEFGINGTAITAYADLLGTNSQSLTIQPDGKIVVAGGTLENGIYKYAVSRYIPGSCNSNFTLFPDTAIPHHYWAENVATGIPPLSYYWNWGDGTYDSIAYPSHTYATAGFYTICLTIEDSDGCASNYCPSYNLLKMSAAEAANTIITVDVVSDIPTTIQSWGVLQSWPVFPNPASKNAFIDYTLSASANVSIEMFDVLGNKLQQVVNDKQDAGEYHSKIDIAKLTNGIYILQIHAGDQIASQKMVVIN